MMMTRLRDRLLSRGALAMTVAAAALGASAACSLVLDTSAKQCSTDADCKAKGGVFAEMTCSSTGVCVAPEQPDGGAGGGDAGGSDPTAEISAGHFHTCARLVSGKVLCWGNNSEGQIGDGKDPAASPIAGLPQPVKNVSDAVGISCGEADNCALGKDQSVWCWGAADEGQLGNGSLDPVLGAVQVVGISKGAAAAAGDAFNCAILTSGNVVCWGINIVGQLGDGKDPAIEPRSLLPVQVQGITDAVELSLGESHACAVLASGKVMCWGHNDFGQLGMGQLDAGQPEYQNVPIEVGGLPSAKHIELGEKHSCALTATNEAWCWGSNDMGQLGDDGASGATSPAPVKVVGLVTPKVISAAGSHTCARTEDGEVFCWGSNGNGESGQDPTKVANTGKPMVVAGVSGASAVTVGNEHACALLGTRKVTCWGHNNLGQLGDDMNEVQSFAPIEVHGLD